MAKFSEKFEDGLMLVAEKVDDNKYLGAIKNAFTTFMPFIIVGSFATLFNTLLCSTTTGLAAFIPSLASLSPAFTAINFATLSIMALPIVFLIGVEMARKNKVPEYICAIACLAGYICVVPQTVSVVVEGATAAAAGLPGAAIGAQGLFIGMIVAILVSELFSALMKIEKIKIKMPASVPHAIAQSFNTLVPILITLVVTSVIGTVFHLMTGSYLNNWIYEVVQAPLEAVFQSPVKDNIVFHCIVFPAMLKAEGSYIPVAYTHLDVYKRQLLGRSPIMNSPVFSFAVSGAQLVPAKGRESKPLFSK